MNCPLCDADNQCLANTPNVANCWCMTKTFHEWVLAQIPEDAKNKACICEGCLTKYSELLKELPND
ncbi:cysteine-rich CWC family protein [Caryophanon tenue]|uniref:cysteine-rich CWC family protein n=1 Tax=Caryophanon tenue TaxID=33978 RepID=UPI00147111F1|nr:cysteine-rich CWC family protein [Caryophanon tenue]